MLVDTALEFTCDDGRTLRVKGPFAAFIDPLATEESILGRDVLNNFDVIISKLRDEILILAPNHHYHVSI